MSRNPKKIEYFNKLVSLFQEYSKMFIVNVDMVGSKQIQNVRMAIRGKGELLMGKNTMIRKCLRDNVEEMPFLKDVLERVEGNCGLLFIKDDFTEIRKILADNFVGAAARPGVIAPIDVSIEKGPTTLQPTETNFFQALNISTKITKGAIEILNDVDLIHKGKKVLPGQAALLQKMGIRPFTYGMEIQCVYDNGSVFEPAVLDISDDQLLSSFQAGLSAVAALSLASGYPTLASVPHSFINGYKNVLAVSLGSDYTFPLAQKIKDFLSDPEAMAAAAAAAASAPAASSAGASSAAEPAKAPEPEPEEEEEEEEDVDFDLFD